MFARAARGSVASSRVLSRHALRNGAKPSLPASSLATTATTQAALPDGCRHLRRSSSSFSSSPSRSSRQTISHQRVLTIFEDEAEHAASEPEHVPGTKIALLRTVADIRKWTSQRPPRGDQDQGIALVPTMGALHEGHTNLMLDAAKRGHDRIVVSIYLNPAQFGASEDLDSYPKTWDGDCDILRGLLPELERARSAASADAPKHDLELAVFAPTTREMFPSGYPGQDVDSKGSFVTITPVGEVLEGRARPTFFRGVATVCMKLFNIVLPSRAFFGQKDVQQTVVLRRMVRDFHLPLDLVVVPTARDPQDGLALSSRNVYLGTRRRRVAPVLVSALRAAERAYLEDGAVEAAEILPAALRVVLDTLDAQRQLPPSEGVLFQLDYVSLADPDTMEEIDEIDPARGAILSGAIKMLPVYESKEGEDLGYSGGPPVRLIDNIILPPRK